MVSSATPSLCSLYLIKQVQGFTQSITKLGGTNIISDGTIE